MSNAATSAPTNAAPRGSLPVASYEDAFVLRAMRGQASFAETLAWLSLTEGQLHRAARRLAEEDAS